MRPAKNSTEALKAAKWLLENVGWVKKTWSKTDDTTGKTIGFCAIGALDSVEVTARSVRNKAIDRLEKVVPYGFIIDFNDHPHRSKKEVLAAFDRAIKQTKKSRKP